MDTILRELIEHEDPCIRYRALTEICGVSAKQATELREELRQSPRVARLLSVLDARGMAPTNVYAKYTGAHWILADLADIGYPASDGRLLPLRDQVQDYWLSPKRTAERVVPVESARMKSYPGVPIIDGRARRCASQEGNALYSILALGLADDRTHQLAKNLARWQWPDGGWNCDRKTAAKTSSFHESLLPLRGLSLHARLTGSSDSKVAADRAAQVFLERRLFRRKSNGEIINESFLKLRYPHYWQYDILIALKVLAEAGYIGDPRCSEALDILESKRLENSGWRAEGKHYKVVDQPTTGGSRVDWGPVSRRQVMNPFITLDALYVLKKAGRYRAEG